MNIEPHLPLVRALMKRMPWHLCDRDDLFQQGCVGLLIAARRFDPERGVAFSTWAVPYILGEMRKLCRESAPVHIPRPEREARARVRRAIAALTASLRRDPTMDELASALHMDAADLPLLMEDVVAVPEEAIPESGREDVHLALADALCGLPETRRRMLVLHYLQGMTQQEVAAQLGISQMAVSRGLRASDEQHGT